MSKLAAVCRFLIAAWVYCTLVVGVETELEWVLSPLFAYIRSHS